MAEHLKISSPLSNASFEARHQWLMDYYTLVNEIEKTLVNIMAIAFSHR